jgi:hypothetical protein
MGWHAPLHVLYTQYSFNSNASAECFRIQWALGGCGIPARAASAWLWLSRDES